jgi:soluble lytic murein transglycosylase-like protein
MNIEVVKAWLEFVFVMLILGLIFSAIALETADASTGDEVEAIVREVAAAEEFDPDLAVAIADVESGLNPDAVGSLGELGVYQLRPEYHAVKRGAVRQNIVAAIRYLKHVRELCEPKWGDAWFIGFNVGPHYEKPIRYPTLFPYYLKVKAAIEARLAANE